MSEKSLINTLLVVCLALGFLCVATIYLPSKVQLAPSPTPLPRGEGVRGRVTNASSLLALLPQEKAAGQNTAPPMQLNDGTYVRFTPEPDPNRPFNVAQASASRWDQGGAAPQPDPPAPTGLQERTSALTRVHKQSSLALYDPTKSKNPKERSWFTVPPELEPDVQFWRNIYSKYDSHQVVLHDMKYLPIIYGVLDFTDLDADQTMTDIERQKEKQASIDGAKESIIVLLDELSANPPADQLSERAREIKQLFNVVGEQDKFRQAKERGVRAQTGQKDKFMAGLAYSNRYLGEIESIFEHMGLPRELTFLVFVESMFNPGANSSAGARGVWQFMRTTGKIYGLKINSIVDERADPIRETYAAASLLSHDYEILGNWPLAINAYNTGRGKIAQAMARLGTSNISSIIKYFDHPAYGFASRNFYLEFLAALDVAKNYQRYFGNIRFDPPLRYDFIQVGNSINLPAVAQAIGIPIEEIAEMNPAYTQAVISGKLPLPAGSELRVPERKGELFLAYAARAPQMFPLWHTVEEGETIQEIAAMYNVSASSIARANKIAGKRLHAGQELKITR